jgi:hypothetical protein
MERVNIQRMPGGTAQLELRKGPDVNVRFTAHSLDGTETLGPYTEEGYITLPSSVGSFDVSLDIPPL